MSLLKTKPRWCAFAEAAENGWINGKTGELLVSIRGLKSKLALEQTTETQEKTIMIKETKTEEMIVELKEQTVKKPKKNQKIIAEVVEHVLDNKEIIGE